LCFFFLFRAGSLSTFLSWVALHSMSPFPPRVALYFLKPITVKSASKDTNNPTKIPPNKIPAIEQLACPVVPWSLQLLLSRESVYKGHVVSANKISFSNFKMGEGIESQNSKQVWHLRHGHLANVALNTTWLRSPVQRRVESDSCIPGCLHSWHRRCSRETTADNTVSLCSCKQLVWLYFSFLLNTQTSWQLMGILAQVYHYLGSTGFTLQKKTALLSKLTLQEIQGQTICKITHQDIYT